MCVFLKDRQFFFLLLLIDFQFFVSIYSDTVHCNWFNIHFPLWDIFACLLIRMQWWSMRNRDWGLCGV